MFLQNLYLSYETLQFPVEINTRGRKTLTNVIPFHTNYDLQGQKFDQESQIFAHTLAEYYYVMTSKQF